MLPPLSSASPVSGLPLSAVSHFCTFAQELRSDLHLCTSCSGPPVLQSSCPLAVSLLPYPPPLHPTPPQQPQAFRMPGKTEGQADDNQREPWRQGQGNGNQSRDDQDRSRDHPGRLDNTEHTFKVPISPTTQATPSLLWVGSGPRHGIADANSFSGPRSRPSGPGFRCSGTGSGSGPVPAPVPAPDPRLPRPET